MKKRILAGLLLLMMVVSLVACGGSGEQGKTTPTGTPTTGVTTTPEVTKTPELTPEVTPTPEAGPITLTDAAGREIVLEAPAERIVSGYYLSTYACIALGMKDKVVGLEKKANTRPIYHLAAPEFLELPAVGTMKELDVELVASLTPDLVLLPMKLKSYGEALDALGISYAFVYPESREQLCDMLTLIATACGNAGAGEALIDYYETKDAFMAGLGESGKSVVICSNSSYLSVAPTKMYQHTLIAAAGGSNACTSEEDYWVEISYEDWLTMNPDVIVIPSGAEYSKEDLMADPELSVLDAVVNGQVYAMPMTTEELDSPVPSGVIGAMWLASILHEDSYSFDKFTADVVDFYQTFYGVEITTDMVTK